MIICVILLVLYVIAACGQEEVTQVYDPQDCLVDVGFSLDGSGSLTLVNWMLTLRFVSEFSRNVKFGQDGTRIGVVSFGNAATLDVTLDAFSDALTFGNVVQHIRYKDENTNTASGIRLMREQLFNVSTGDRANVPNIGIVITDGASTWEKNMTIREADLSREADIVMFAIGIGQAVNFDELRGIANEPDDTYMLYVDEFTDLKNITDMIVNLACGHQLPYMITESGDGWITDIPIIVDEEEFTTIVENETDDLTTVIIIEEPSNTTTPRTVDTATNTSSTSTKPSTTTSTTTTTTSPTTTITTSPTTTTTTSPTTTTTTRPLSTTQEVSSSGVHKIDLALLLDSSGSIGWESWQNVKGFVKTFVKSLQLDTGIVQLALIEYSTQSYLKVPLGNYTSSSEVEDIVDNLAWLNQRTNTSGAIRMAYDKVFTSNPKKRFDASDVMLVVTDGDSNTDNHFMTQEGDHAKAMGIHMFTVGIGNKTSMKELQKITSKPYHFFMHLMKDFDSLSSVLEILQSEVVQDSYPITPLPVSFEDCPADMVIIVDVPHIMADQAVGIANGLTRQSSPSDRQHTVVITTAQTGYETSEGEDLADAIRYVRDSIFNPKNVEDDRKDTQNVVVVITTTVHGNQDNIRYQMESLNRENIKVYTITIGVYASDDIMKDLTSDPKEDTYSNVESINGMDGDLNLLSRYSRQICAMSSRVLWSCSFELSEPALCNMRFDPEADFRWTITNVQTPSRHTGPDRAFHGNYFAYIEASSPRRSGDRAIFYLPFTADGTFCLTFRYHMKGYHIGVLDIFVLRRGTESLVWRMSGQQGEDWLYGQLLLILKEGDEVGIRGIRAKEFSGDIGIDLLAIARGPCPSEV